MGLTALASALVACGGSSFEPAAGEGNFAGSFSSDGVDRTYLAHTPPGFSSTEALPLVVVLHGVPGTAQSVRSLTAMDPIADELRFVVAYPDAAFGEWAAGCDCSRAEAEGVSNTRFVQKLIDEVHRRLGIDRTRVLATGFSQGALMAYRLGCDIADRVAAVAPVAATMLDAVAERCVPSRPLPILIVHGTADPEFPPQGRVGESVSAISIDATVDKWLDANGCEIVPAATHELDAVDDGTRVLRHTYRPCRQGVTAEFVAVDGGGHTWPGSPVEFSPHLGPKSLEISASRLVGELALQPGGP